MAEPINSRAREYQRQAELCRQRADEVSGRLRERWLELAERFELLAAHVASKYTR